ncbi:MAG: hypothetical protein WCF19_07120 [Chlamydiales bacterium]
MIEKIRYFPAGIEICNHFRNSGQWNVDFGAIAELVAEHFANQQIQLSLLDRQVGTFVDGQIAHWENLMHRHGIGKEDDYKSVDPFFLQSGQALRILGDAQIARMRNSQPILKRMLRNCAEAQI